MTEAARTEMQSSKCWPAVKHVVDGAEMLHWSAAALERSRAQLAFISGCSTLQPHHCCSSHGSTGLALQLPPGQSLSDLGAAAAAASASSILCTQSVWKSCSNAWCCLNLLVWFCFPREICALFSSKFDKGRVFQDAEFPYLSWNANVRERGVSGLKILQTEKQQHHLCACWAPEKPARRALLWTARKCLTLTLLHPILKLIFISSAAPWTSWLYCSRDAPPLFLVFYVVI